MFIRTSRPERCGCQQCVGARGAGKLCVPKVPYAKVVINIKMYPILYPSMGHLAVYNPWQALYNERELHF